MEIDFSKVAPSGIRVLIGHDKGVAARAALGLDKLDDDQQEVVFLLPESIRTLTPSFVQGLFAASVHKIGEKGFFAKYKFRTSPQIINDIRAGIDRALTSRHLSGVH